MPERAQFAPNLGGRLKRLLVNRMTDARHARVALPRDAINRLADRVAASERRHSGQICICMEAGLPWSYIRRHAPVRERAITQFGKLRVWDTAANNGVLIYLLLAERAIEIVADRGLHAAIDPSQWQSVTQHMGEAFAKGQFEDGLTLALEEVSALLVEHFPVSADAPRPANELPNVPVVVV